MVEQKTRNIKKLSRGKTQKTTSLVSIIILEFFSLFCLIMVSTLRHCWPKLLSHSAMPSASRGPSYSMGSPGESPKKLEIKIDWFQARIREIFREKTFPWKIAGLFVEPRRCLFVYSFKVLGYKSNDSRLKSATSIHEVLQCRIRRNLAKNPAAKGKWNREYLVNTCAYAYVYLFIYIYIYVYTETICNVPTKVFFCPEILKMKCLR